VAASRLRPSPQASAPPAAPARAARAPAKKIVSPKDGATLLDCSKRPNAEAETFAEASCLTSSSSAIHGMAIVAPALTKARGSVPPHGMRYTAPAAHQGVRDDRRRNEKEHALRLVPEVEDASLRAVVGRQVPEGAPRLVPDALGKVEAEECGGGNEEDHPHQEEQRLLRQLADAGLGREGEEEGDDRQ